MPATKPLEVVNGMDGWGRDVVGGDWTLIQWNLILMNSMEVKF